MKNRKKKIAMVVIALCVITGLAVAIHKPKITEEIAQPTEVTTPEITVAPIKITPKKAVTTTKSAKENPSELLDEPNDESETADITDAEQGEEIVQNFTAATKPEPPAPPEIPSEQATNPAEPPTYKPEQTTVTEATTAPKVKTPQGGETKNGQIYLPGFGWIKDEGGGMKAVPADDMRENGNKIGTFG